MLNRPYIYFQNISLLTSFVLCLLPPGVILLWFFSFSIFYKTATFYDYFLACPYFENLVLSKAVTLPAFLPERKKATAKSAYTSQPIMEPDWLLCTFSKSDSTTCWAGFPLHLSCYNRSYKPFDLHSIFFPFLDKKPFFSTTNVEFWLLFTFFWKQIENSCTLPS